MLPIAIFAYNRPKSLENLIASLRENPKYEGTDTFIFIDGYKRNSARTEWEEVVKVAQKEKNRKGNTSIIVSEKNKGLSKSIIGGVNSVLEKYDSVIVLEDDLVCMPNFLNFMDQAIQTYKDNRSIISVCGYGLKIKKPTNYDGDVYLSGRSSSWGWATWKDRWESIDWDVRDWNDFSKNKQEIKAFNRNGSDMFSMLKDYMEGKNNSWAIRFCYSQFKQRKHAIIPFFSLIDNQGFGEDATNCKQTYSRFKIDADNRTEQITFNLPTKISPNPHIAKQCYRYHSIMMRIYSKIRNLISK